MPVRLTEKARVDFIELYTDGVERFGYQQAEAYADGIERVFDILADNLELARLRTEMNPPVRIHPHGSHLIVYEVQDRSVLVLRIRHARENWSDAPI